ncbi:Calx-beta domain-containing protein [Lentzea fradiae]|uniref:Calx-beta domain-containing protein n=1 Tax=Lentzea fradiae TaxID=200378 RepID=A0A1G7VZI5_9PSEU|nr:Calx-beta domain-containing protein [Lentzea fradiae]SDG65186.1 Calx-beta domain-containing protein [Lentzea fradiae]
MKTIMVLLLLVLGVAPAYAGTECEPPDCPDVVDAHDGPVHEKADSYTATLRARDGEADENVEVTYRFVDGTAKLGQDYLAEPRAAVTIRAGTGEAGVPYRVLRVTGEQKRFTLEITSVRNGVVGKRIAVFTIGGTRGRA